MRAILLSFSEYAATLPPHETAYLLSIQQFENKVKLSILQRLHQNFIQIQRITPYDEQIDKRKYSSLKAWITDRLQENDMDAQFEWMIVIERKTIPDSTESEEYKSILPACYPLVLRHGQLQGIWLVAGAPDSEKLFVTEQGGNCDSNGKRPYLPNPCNASI